MMPLADTFHERRKQRGVQVAAVLIDCDDIVGVVRIEHAGEDVAVPVDIQIAVAILAGGNATVADGAAVPEIDDDFFSSY